MTPPLPRPTRRTVLALGAAVVGSALGGCREGSAVPARPDGAGLLDAALAEEVALLAAYDAAAAAVPRMRATLDVVRGHHAVHRVALLEAGARPGPLPSAAAGTPGTPGSPAAVRRALARAESRAAAARGLDCLAGPRRLAPLLASIAASESSHVAALGVRA